MAGPTILLTGGTGKTGRRIAARLAREDCWFRLASRSGESIGRSDSVRFDWMDESSYRDALIGISAIYLVAPANVTEPLATMRPLLERALTDGARRFVLLSASSIEEDGPMMGKVHAFLRQNAPEWAVLRPTWFMQNFSEQQHMPTIRNERRIYTATADGRVPFVDADDIASVGVRALMTDAPLNRDIIITGPNALSYGEVATIIGRAIGQTVEHVRLTESELVQRLEAQGMPDAYAEILAAMDTKISRGSEDRVTDEVEAITGRRPKDLQTFADEVRGGWINRSR